MVAAVIVSKAAARPLPSISLPCRFLLPLFCVSSAAARRIFFFRGDEAVLRGFLAIEDGAAGAADGYSVLDFFGADRAIGERAGVVQPGLLESELAGAPGLTIGDEHWGLGPLPL